MRSTLKRNRRDLDQPVEALNLQQLDLDADEVGPNRQCGSFGDGRASTYNVTLASSLAA